MFFSKVMEGLDFITLYVALSPGQVESIMGGGVAMPQESSQRFGLRTSKEGAIAVMTLLSGSASTFGVVKMVKYLYSHTQGLYSLHTSSVCHRIPPEEHWRSTGSDKANRVQMERWNSASRSHE